MMPDGHLLQDRFLKSIQVESHQVLLEIRPIDVALPFTNSKNTWLLPQHWDELIEILRKVAVDHVKKNSRLRTLTPDKCIQTVQGELSTVAYYFTPYHAAISSIFGQFQSNVVDPRDALQDGNSNWLHRKPYKNMIVAAVSPRYKEGRKYFLSDYKYRKLKCKYPSTLILDSDDDSDCQQMSFEKTTRDDVPGTVSSTPRCSGEVGGEQSRSPPSDVDDGVNPFDFLKVCCSVSPKSVESDSEFRNECGNFLPSSQKVVTELISKYSGKPSVMISSDIDWSQNMLEIDESPPTCMVSSPASPENNLHCNEEVNIKHSYDLTRLNIFTTGISTDNFKLTNRSKQGTQVKVKKRLQLPTHSMCRRSNMVLSSSDDLDHSSLSQSFVPHTSCGEETMSRNSTGPHPAFASQSFSFRSRSPTVDINCHSQLKECSYSDSGMTGNVEQSGFGVKQQSRRKSTHSMGRRSSVMKPSGISEQSAVANLDRYVDATHEINTSVVDSLKQSQEHHKNNGSINDFHRNRSSDYSDNVNKLSRTMSQRTVEQCIDSADLHSHRLQLSKQSDYEGDVQKQTRSFCRPSTKKCMANKSSSNDCTLKKSLEPITPDECSEKLSNAYDTSSTGCLVIKKEKYRCRASKKKDKGNTYQISLKSSKMSALFNHHKKQSQEMKTQKHNFHPTLEGNDDSISSCELNDYLESIGYRNLPRNTAKRKKKIKELFGDTDTCSDDCQASPSPPKCSSLKVCINQITSSKRNSKNRLRKCNNSDDDADGVMTRQLSRSKELSLAKNEEHTVVSVNEKRKKSQVGGMNGKHTKYGKLHFHNGQPSTSVESETEACTSQSPSVLKRKARKTHETSFVNESQNMKEKKEKCVKREFPLSTSTTPENNGLFFSSLLESVDALNRMNDMNLDEGSLQEFYDSKKFSMEDLSSDNLVKQFKKNIRYLQEIYKGYRPCQRHDRYKAGGEQQQSLVYAVTTSPYSEKQLGHLIRLCVDEFCDDNLAKRKHFNYISKVLVPEICTKMFMDRFSMSHDEALKTIDFAYIRNHKNGCDN